MLRAGNLARAEQIYQSVLSSGGSDHAALTGLGKVALRRGQNGEAITFFERALARQPQYFPARLGVADALWNSGRADAAKARYAALRERYADNMIPPRIVERTR
jgi:Flp pilus assembly protein TadD